MLVWHFPVIKLMGFREAVQKKLFRIAIAIWECAIRIALHIAVASRDWGH